MEDLHSKPIGLKEDQDMRINCVGFTKRMLVRLLLAVPLGIAINAFAFTPNAVNAAPCQDCNPSNFCQNVSFGGGHICVDSGDGGSCFVETYDCPDRQQW
jgi:hypothetical protein